MIGLALVVGFLVLLSIAFGYYLGATRNSSND